MAGPGLEEEEELWLYGGSLARDEENGPATGNATTLGAQQDTGAERQGATEAMQPVTHSCSDTEEDSDKDSDDDDVKVTIGDIRTGLPYCMTSEGNPRTSRGYGSSVGKQRGIDLTSPGCINGLPVLEVDLDSFEEKPWRKPGADLSDYFNYGFNEATWKVYCEKQRRLQLGLDHGYHPCSKENRISVQQGGTGNASNDAEPEPKCGTECEGTNIPENTSNRTLRGTMDMVCSITTVEGRRWDSHEPQEIAIQVVGDHEYKPHLIPQHQHPPPPLLLPPTITPNPPPLFSAPPPPHFLQRPPPPTQMPPPMHLPVLLPPPLLPPPTAHHPPINGPPVPYNSRPPIRHGYNSADPAIMNYPPASTNHTSWATAEDKGNSNTGRNDWVLRRDHEWDLGRDRKHPPNTSYRNEGSQYSFYSRGRSSEYQHKYQHSRERSREQEDRSRGDHRQRDREERNKHKSSRRKMDSEERENHRRHKRKKSKRGKEDKGSSDEVSHGSRE
ncbi:pre-mRNA 3'-end-processing factor FIP1 isoform X1 [Xenopus tropicalis]|uniref:Pre-mRNA 3'-end-processing factor FIP1 isoform X1 n=1 Tax=Xenopus tropicalis TaxID=8364 RepID=A0A8J1IM29_XENTR|nr:pre-mRNA 3'-end-processing factor FIP1 isoform X1 [Xenopus tropicalis]